ncbi:MAG: hypothetical protein MUE36_12315 [Acidimicrobiales bacterium]|jgi:hypothetical protein|nr:hypothetical protein [Acidimicrobiales bacterium]
MRRLVTVGLLAAALAAAWHRFVTPWQQRWGATDDEVHMALPGDDLVAEPADQVTRAVTVDASPGDVWPWLLQLGADRGGFYSYEALENLFGLGIHNRDVIVPEWQERAVGDLVLADAKGSGGWYVVEVVPREALVLKVADVKAGRPVRRDEQLRWEFQWTFVVRPAPGGRSRLIVRERTGFDSRLTRALMAPIGVVSFVMTQRMLRGIKTCAERSRTAEGDPTG